MTHRALLKRFLVGLLQGVVLGRQFPERLGCCCSLLLCIQQGAFVACSGLLQLFKLLLRCLLVHCSCLAPGLLECLDTLLPGKTMAAHDE